MIRALVSSRRCVCISIMEIFQFFWDRHGYNDTNVGLHQRRYFDVEEAEKETSKP